MNKCVAHIGMLHVVTVYVSTPQNPEKASMNSTDQSMPDQVWTKGSSYTLNMFSAKLEDGSIKKAKKEA